MNIRVRKIRFGRGLRWLPAGAELLFSSPGPLAGVAGLWLLVSLVAVIPIIGQGLLAVLTPLLTAGVLYACAQVAAGQRPAPTTLFAGWQDPQRRGMLLLLGLWGIVGSVVAVSILAGWLGAQLDAEQLEAAMASPEALAATLAETSVGGGVLLAALVMLLVMATLYFAIPLVMFARQPVMRSLLQSLQAILHNLLAFIGLGMAVFLFALAVGLILLVLSSVVSIALGEVGAMLAQVLFLLVTMFVQMVMAATQYVAFRDVFELPTDGDDQGDGEDRQLLA
ncbi:hypothetical protein IC757_15045 [Wenzhouxiangella sp. AB-CW3]|uniref:BPSS1780 family membrane protein n=1 Tax=Wenzhouxiangella sp. AB-CW3 TaxID=2771012 RepID=UPI00168B62F2|nr:BPSS1780 family membrane protein [Wenzhouxiangella sp. AB-CW3]QOC22314.1 hypothetical protein IC757_15045 [Wenzhouxiangella sp. AB-CW3]